jgi:hypothetical protein
MSDKAPSLNLESEAVKPHLIRDLALEEKTQRALALEYGVTPAAISLFRKRHQDEVTNYRETLPNKIQDLWIADKEQRIKEMQADVELLEGSEDADDIKVRLAIFKAVEEALGQAPPKMTVNVTKQVNYTVKGVNLEDLS